MSTIISSTNKPKSYVSDAALVHANAPAVAGYARTATAQAVKAVIDNSGKGGGKGGQGTVLDQGLQDGQGALQGKLKDLAQAKAELSKQSDALPALQKQAAQAQGVADQRKAQLDQAQAAAAPAEQALKNAQDAANAAAAGQQQAQAAVDAAQAEFNQAQGVGGIIARLTGRLAPVQDKLTAAQAQLNQAQAATAATQAQLAQAQAAAAPLTQAAQAAQAQWQAAAAQAQGANNAVQAQNGQIAQAQAAVKAAQDSVAQVQAGILALAQKVDAAQPQGKASAVAQASQQIAQAQLQHNAQEVQAAQAAVKAQEQALAQAQAKVAQERDKVAPLQAAASAAEEQAAQRKGELDAAQGPHVNAQAQIAKWQSALDSANASLATAQAALAQGQALMATAGTWHKHNHVIIGQQGAQYKIDTANGQINAAQAQAALAQAKLAEAQAQAAAPAQALAAAQARYDSAAQAAKAARAQADVQAQAAGAAVDQEIAARQALATAQSKVVDILQAQATAAASAIGKGAHLSATAAGTQQAQDAAQALVATQQGVLAAARAKADAERAQGKPLDEAAAKAEAAATQLKGKADEAQLAATRAQAKVDAQQQEVDAARAALAQGQAKLDKAVDDWINAGVNIKKSKHRRPAQEDAIARENAARQEMSAAQARIDAAQPLLAQAQADAYPVLKAAQEAQAKWQAAAELAGVARNKANVQVKTTQQAAGLEVAAQASLQAAQTTLAQLAQVEGGVRQEQVDSGLLSQGELSDIVKAKQQQVSQATAAVDSQEHTLGSAGAAETQERAAATPLQAKAYAGQLIAGNLIDDAKSTAKAHQGAADAVQQAQSQLDAANQRVDKADQALRQAKLALAYAEGKVNAKKQQKAIAKAQPVVDAAQKELAEAQAGQHSAQLALAAAKRAAAPLLKEAQDAELAARGAVQAAQAQASAADAQGQWVGLAGVRQQAADDTLATAQARLVQATKLHAQLLKALAGASGDSAAAKTLSAQAKDGQAWAQQYAQLADGQRAAAHASHDQQVQADAAGVQAAGAQSYGVWLESKVAAAAQTYEQSRAVLPELQGQFGKASQKAVGSAQATNAAHAAMVEKDLDTALQFAAARGAKLPQFASAAPVTAEDMKARAVQVLGEQAQKSAAGAQGAAGAGAGAGTPAALPEASQIQALAEKLAEQENQKNQGQRLADKAAALSAWQASQMAKRTSLVKQLHLMDDMAQYKEGNAELTQTREQTVASARDTVKASQAAIDAGEAVQTAVGHALRMGDALQAAQSQLKDASQFALQASQQAGALAQAALQAHQGKQNADNAMLAGLQHHSVGLDAAAQSLSVQAGNVKDPGVAQLLRGQAQLLKTGAADVAALTGNAKSAADAAAKQAAAAQASVASWATTVQAMGAWAQKEGLSADDVKAAVAQGAQMLKEFAKQSAGELKNVYQLNDWANGILKEEADRKESVTELHQRRQRADKVEKKRKMQALIKMAIMSVVAMAALAAGQAWVLGPMIGAASAAVGATLGTIVGTAATFGLAGAVGSAVGQGLSIAAGVQQGFDLKSMALTGASAALTAGLFTGAQSTAIGATLLPAAGEQALTLGQLAARGLTSATINAGVQGGMVAVGLQEKFDWAQVAVAGLAAAGGAKVSNLLDQAQLSADSLLGAVMRSSELAGNLVRSAGGSLVNAAVGLGVGSVAAGDSFQRSVLGKLNTLLGAIDVSPLAGSGSGAAQQPHPNASVAEAAHPVDFQGAQKAGLAHLDIDMGTLAAAGGARVNLPEAPTLGQFGGSAPKGGPLGGVAQVLEGLHQPVSSGLHQPALSTAGTLVASAAPLTGLLGQPASALEAGAGLPGQPLHVEASPVASPAASVKVRPGDTLDALAKPGASVAEIAAYNDLTSWHLKAGQTLDIPPQGLAEQNPQFRAKVEHYEGQLKQYRQAFDQNRPASASAPVGGQGTASGGPQLGQTVSTRAGLPTGAPLGASPSAVAANVPAGLPAPAAYERVNSKGMQLNELAAKYGVKPEEIAAASGLKHFYLPPGDMEVVIPRSYLLMDAKFQQLVDYYKPQYEKYQASQKTGAPDTSLERGGLQETAGLNPLSPANYQNVIDPKTGQLTLQSTRIELNPPLSALELQKQVQAELNQKFQAQQQPTPEAKPPSQANYQNVIDPKTGQPRLQTTHIELGAEASAQRAQAQAKLNQLFQAEIQPAAKPAPSQANQQMVLGDNGWELKSTQIALDAGTAAALDAQGGPIGRPTSTIAGERGKAAVDRYLAGWQGLIEAGAGVVGATAVEHAAYGSRVNNDHAAEQALQRAKELGAIDHSSQIKNLGDFGNYATGHLITSLPYIAEMVPGALTGGATLAARAALGATAQTLSRARALGGTLGGVAASYPSSVGEILQAQRQHGGNTDLGAAGLFGVFNAGFNAVGVEGQLFSGALFRNGVKALDSLGGVIGGTTRAGVSALKNAGSEGFAESVQDAITHGGVQAAVPNAKYQFDPESFIAGAAVGGPLAASGGWQRSEGYRPAATAQAGGFNAGRAGAAAGGFASSAGSAGTLTGSASSLPKTVIDAPTTGVGQIPVPGTLGSNSALAGVKGANGVPHAAGSSATPAYPLHLDGGRTVDGWYSLKNPPALLELVGAPAADGKPSGQFFYYTGVGLTPAKGQFSYRTLQDGRTQLTVPGEAFPDAKGQAVTGSGTLNFDGAGRLVGNIAPPPHAVAATGTAPALTPKQETMNAALGKVKPVENALIGAIDMAANADGSRTTPKHVTYEYKPQSNHGLSATVTDGVLRIQQLQAGGNQQTLGDVSQMADALLKRAKRDGVLIDSVELVWPKSRASQGASGTVSFADTAEKALKTEQAQLWSQLGFKRVTGIDAQPDRLMLRMSTPQRFVENIQFDDVAVKAYGTHPVGDPQRRELFFQFERGDIVPAGNTAQFFPSGQASVQQLLNLPAGVEPGAAGIKLTDKALSPLAILQLQQKFAGVEVKLSPDGQGGWWVHTGNRYAVWARDGEGQANNTLHTHPTEKPPTDQDRSNVTDPSQVGMVLTPADNEQGFKLTEYGPLRNVENKPAQEIAPHVLYRQADDQHGVVRIAATPTGTRLDGTAVFEPLTQKQFNDAVTAAVEHAERAGVKSLRFEVDADQFALLRNGGIDQALEALPQALRNQYATQRTGWSPELSYDFKTGADNDLSRIGAFTVQLDKRSVIPLRGGSTAGTTDATQELPMAINFAQAGVNFGGDIHADPARRLAAIRAAGITVDGNTFKRDGQSVTLEDKSVVRGTTLQGAKDRIEGSKFVEVKNPKSGELANLLKDLITLDGRITHLRVPIDSSQTKLSVLSTEVGRMLSESGYDSRLIQQPSGMGRGSAEVEFFLTRSKALDKRAAAEKAVAEKTPETSAVAAPAPDKNQLLGVDDSRLASLQAQGITVEGNIYRKGDASLSLRRPPKTWGNLKGEPPGKVTISDLKNDKDLADLLQQLIPIDGGIEQVRLVLPRDTDISATEVGKALKKLGFLPRPSGNIAGGRVEFNFSPSVNTKKRYAEQRRQVREQILRDALSVDGQKPTSPGPNAPDFGGDIGDDGPKPLNLVVRHVAVGEGSLIFGSVPDHPTASIAIEPRLPGEVIASQLHSPVAGAEGEFLARALKQAGAVPTKRLTLAVISDPASLAIYRSPNGDASKSPAAAILQDAAKALGLTLGDIKFTDKDAAYPSITAEIKASGGTPAPARFFTEPQGAKLMSLPPRAPDSPMSPEELDYYIDYDTSLTYPKEPSTDATPKQEAPRPGGLRLVRPNEPAGSGKTAPQTSAAPAAKAEPLSRSDLGLSASGALNAQVRFQGGLATFRFDDISVSESEGDTVKNSILAYAKRLGANRVQIEISDSAMGSLENPDLALDSSLHDKVGLHLALQGAYLGEHAEAYDFQSGEPTPGQGMWVYTISLRDGGGGPSGGRKVSGPDFGGDIGDDAGPRGKGKTELPRAKELLHSDLRLDKLDTLDAKVRLQDGVATFRFDEIDGKNIDGVKVQDSIFAYAKGRLGADQVRIEIPDSASGSIENPKVSLDPFMHDVARLHRVLHDRYWDEATRADAYAFQSGEQKPGKMWVYNISLGDWGDGPSGRGPKGKPNSTSGSAGGGEVAAPSGEASKGDSASKPTYLSPAEIASRLGIKVEKNSEGSEKTYKYGGHELKVNLFGLSGIPKQTAPFETVISSDNDSAKEQRALLEKMLLIEGNVRAVVVDVPTDDLNLEKRFISARDRVEHSPLGRLLIHKLGYRFAEMGHPEDETGKPDKGTIRVAFTWDESGVVSTGRKLDIYLKEQENLLLGKEPAISENDQDVLEVGISPTAWRLNAPDKAVDDRIPSVRERDELLREAGISINEFPDYTVYERGGQQITITNYGIPDVTTSVSRDDPRQPGAAAQQDLLRDILASLNINPVQITALYPRDGKYDLYEMLRSVGFEADREPRITNISGNDVFETAMFSRRRPGRSKEALIQLVERVRDQVLSAAGISINPDPENANNVVYQRDGQKITLHPFGSGGAANQIDTVHPSLSRDDPSNPAAAAQHDLLRDVLTAKHVPEVSVEVSPHGAPDLFRMLESLGYKTESEPLPGPGQDGEPVLRATFFKENPQVTEEAFVQLKERAKGGNASPDGAAGEKSPTGGSGPDFEDTRPWRLPKDPNTTREMPGPKRPEEGIGTGRPDPSQPASSGKDQSSTKADSGSELTKLGGDVPRSVEGDAPQNIFNLPQFDIGRTRGVSQDTIWAHLPGSSEFPNKYLHILDAGNGKIRIYDSDLRNDARIDGGHFLASTLIRSNIVPSLVEVDFSDHLSSEAMQREAAAALSAVETAAEVMKLQVTGHHFDDLDSRLTVSLQPSKQASPSGSVSFEFKPATESIEDVELGHDDVWTSGKTAPQTGAAPAAKAEPLSRSDLGLSDSGALNAQVRFQRGLATFRFDDISVSESEGDTVKKSILAYARRLGADRVQIEISDSATGSLENPNLALDSSLHDKVGLHLALQGAYLGEHAEAYDFQSGEPTPGQGMWVYTISLRDGGGGPSGGRKVSGPDFGGDIGDDAGSKRTSRRLPALKFKPTNAGKDYIEMSISGGANARVLAARDPHNLGDIWVSLVERPDVSLDAEAELLARFLGQEQGFLPRRELRIDLGSFKDADEATELAQKTLALLGMRATAFETHATVKHEPGVLIAETVVGQTRTPAQFFKDGKLGSGPGLEDPTVFDNLVPGDAPRSAPLLPNSELRRQGNNFLTYGVASSDDSLAASPFWVGHVDVLEGQPARVAGNAKLEVVGGGLSDVRFIDGASGHYKPYGENAKNVAEKVFGDLGFDAEGRFIDTFRQPGDPISTDPFPTLTLRRTASSIETYIPKRRDPNPSEPKFIPHFKADYSTDNPGVVNIKTLDLAANFPESYLAAFLAQSLKAHGVHPTQQVTVENIYAHQTDLYDLTLLQQQVIAALDALDIRVREANYQWVDGVKLKLVLDTEQASPGSRTAESVARAAAKVPPRSVTESSQEKFVPLKVPNANDRAIKALKDDFVVHKTSTGATRVGYLGDGAGEEDWVLQVDRLGTLDHNFPKEGDTQAGVTQEMMFKAAAQLLNDYGVPVREIPQLLLLGSSSPLSQQFIELTRQYRQEEGVSLRQAADKAASKLLEQIPLNKLLGFTQALQVHIKDNIVVIEAVPAVYKDGVRVEPTLPRVNLEPKGTTAGNIKPTGDEGLEVLKAFVEGKPAQAAIPASTVEDLLRADPTTVPSAVRLTADATGHVYNLEKDLARLGAALGKVAVEQEGGDLILYRRTDERGVEATGANANALAGMTQNMGHTHEAGDERSSLPTIADHASLLEISRRRKEVFGNDAAPAVDVIAQPDGKGGTRFRTYGPLAPARNLSAADLGLSHIDGTVSYRIQEEGTATAAVTGTPTAELIDALRAYATDKSRDPRGLDAARLRIEFRGPNGLEALRTVFDQLQSRAGEHRVGMNISSVDDYAFIDGKVSASARGRASMPVLDIELYEAGDPAAPKDITQQVPNEKILALIDQVNQPRSGDLALPDAPASRPLTRGEMGSLWFEGPHDPDDFSVMDDDPEWDDEDRTSGDDVARRGSAPSLMGTRKPRSVSINDPEPRQGPSSNGLMPSVPVPAQAFEPIVTRSTFEPVEPSTRQVLMDAMSLHKRRSGAATLEYGDASGSWTLRVDPQGKVTHDFPLDEDIDQRVLFRTIAEKLNQEKVTVNAVEHRYAVSAELGQRFLHQIRSLQEVLNMPLREAARAAAATVLVDRDPTESWQFTKVAGLDIENAGKHLGDAELVLNVVRDNASPQNSARGSLASNAAKDFEMSAETYELLEKILRTPTTEPDPRGNVSRHTGKQARVVDTLLDASPEMRSHLLMYAQTHTVAEIAAAHGVSYDTVYGNLTRLAGKLDTTLDQLPAMLRGDSQDPSLLETIEQLVNEPGEFIRHWSPRDREIDSSALESLSLRDIQALQYSLADVRKPEMASSLGVVNVWGQTNRLLRQIGVDSLEELRAWYKNGEAQLLQDLDRLQESKKEKQEIVVRALLDANPDVRTQLLMYIERNKKGNPKYTMADIAAAHGVSDGTVHGNLTRLAGNMETTLGQLPATLRATLQGAPLSDTIGQLANEPLEFIRRWSPRDEEIDSSAVTSLPRGDISKNTGMQARIVDALLDASPETRSYLLMYVKNHTVADIATAHGVTYDTVRGSLKRLADNMETTWNQLPAMLSANLQGSPISETIGQLVDKPLEFIRRWSPRDKEIDSSTLESFGLREIQALQYLLTDVSKPEMASSLGIVNVWDYTSRLLRQVGVRSLDELRAWYKNGEAQLRQDLDRLQESKKGEQELVVQALLDASPDVRTELLMYIDRNRNGTPKYTVADIAAAQEVSYDTVHENLTRLASNMGTTLPQLPAMLRANLQGASLSETIGQLVNEPLEFTRRWSPRNEDIKADENRHLVVQALLDASPRIRSELLMYIDRNPDGTKKYTVTDIAKAHGVAYNTAHTELTSLSRKMGTNLRQMPEVLQANLPGSLLQTIGQLVNKPLDWIRRWSPRDKEIRSSALESLSLKEIQTLKYLLADVSRPEIASRVGLSIHTVWQYVVQVPRQIGARSVEDLRAWYHKGEAQLLQDLDRLEESKLEQQRQKGERIEKPLPRDPETLATTLLNTTPDIRDAIVAYAKTGSIRGAASQPDLVHKVRGDLDRMARRFGTTKAEFGEALRNLYQIDLKSLASGQDLADQLHRWFAQGKAPISYDSLLKLVPFELRALNSQLSGHAEKSRAISESLRLGLAKLEARSVEDLKLRYRGHAYNGSVSTLQEDVARVLQGDIFGSSVNRAQIEGLSPRLLKTLLGLLDNKSVEEMAKERNIEPRRVKLYVTELLGQLGVKTLKQIQNGYERPTKLRSDIENVLQGKSSEPKTKAQLEGLSLTYLGTLQGLLENKGLGQIAEERHLALRTVRRHLTGIFSNLHIRNLNQLRNNYDGDLLSDVRDLVASRSAAGETAQEPLSLNVGEQGVQRRLGSSVKRGLGGSATSWPVSYDFGDMKLVRNHDSTNPHIIEVALADHPATTLRASVTSEGAVNVQRFTLGDLEPEAAGLFLARALGLANMGAVNALPTTSLQISLFDPITREAIDQPTVDAYWADSSAASTPMGKAMQTALDLLGIDSLWLDYAGMPPNLTLRADTKAGGLSPLSRLPLQNLPAGVQEVPVSQLIYSHEVPRSSAPENYIEELARSIAKNGFDVSNPVEAIRLPNRDLLVIEGHHRVAAMALLGESTVPTKVYEAASRSPLTMAKLLKTAEVEMGYKAPYAPVLTETEKQQLAEFIQQHWPEPVSSKNRVQKLYEQFSAPHLQRDGSRYLEYVPVKGRHFVEAAVDPDGTLQINIKADPALRDSLGSGKDMVSALLERLHKEGISISRVEQVWLPDTTNHSQYVKAIGDLKNSADEALRNKAIAQTWSGRLWAGLDFDTVSNFDFNGSPDGSISFFLEKQKGGALRSVDEI